LCAAMSRSSETARNFREIYRLRPQGEGVSERKNYEMSADMQSCIQTTRRHDPKKEP
jgi:hypothetical protein